MFGRFGNIGNRRILEIGIYWKSAYWKSTKSFGSSKNNYYVLSAVHKGDCLVM